MTAGCFAGVIGLVGEEELGKTDGDVVPLETYEEVLADMLLLVDDTGLLMLSQGMGS